MKPSLLSYENGATKIEITLYNPAALMALTGIMVKLVPEDFGGELANRLLAAHMQSAGVAFRVDKFWAEKGTENRGTSLEINLRLIHEGEDHTGCIESNNPEYLYGLFGRICAELQRTDQDHFFKVPDTQLKKLKADGFIK